MSDTELSLSETGLGSGSPISRLLLMIGTRGLDQLALGGTSLLIARRTGTEDFAPFATIFILYALAAQLGDGGMALAILRMPRGVSFATKSRDQRRAASAALALIGLAIGLFIGGVTGAVVAIGGLMLVTGPAVFVGRASLQRSGNTRRLSIAEAVGALAFVAAVVGAVHDIGDLWLFGLLCVGKQCLELVLQGTSSGVFHAAGEPMRANGVWASQIATYLAANVDYLLVGALLGAEALSVYAIGFRLASAFSSIVSAPLTRTAFVDFANTSDAQTQHDRLVRQIAAFGALGVSATAAVGATLPTVLGDGWEATRAVTILLGIALPWRLLLGPVVALGLTSGRAIRVIGWELFRTAVLVAAIVAGSGSLNGVAGAVSAATILSVSWAYRQAVVGARLSQSSLLQLVGVAAASIAVVAVPVL